MIRNLMQRIFEWNKVFDSPKHDDHDHDAHIATYACSHYVKFGLMEDE